LFEGTIDEIKKENGKPPESSGTDGGYASRANIEYTKGEKIVELFKNFSF
jgi:hypothetical protein